MNATSCLQRWRGVIWNLLIAKSSSPRCERFFYACPFFNGEASGIRKDPDGLLAVRSAYPATLKVGQSFNPKGGHYGQ